MRFLFEVLHRAFAVASPTVNNPSNAKTAITRVFMSASLDDYR
jgi:hypothetical protein